MEEIKKEEEEAEELAKQGEFKRALDKYKDVLERRRGAQGAQSLEVSLS